MSSPLHLEVKQLLVAAANAREVAPEEIGDRDPLFGEGVLGLDSIDALEVAVALQKRWGVRLDDRNLARQVLVDVDTVVAWLRAQGVEDAK